MWKFLIDLVDRLLSNPRQFFKAGLYFIALGLLGLAMLLVLTLPYLWWKRIDPTVFVQSKIRSAQIGLVDYAPNSEEFSDDRVRFLKDAETEVLLIGTVLYRTPKEARGAIVDAVKRGVKVYLLVADPDGAHYPANASFFRDSTAELKKEFEATIAGYLTIRADLQPHGVLPGEFELRIVDRVFPSAMYFYDAQTPKGKLVLVARDFDKNAPEMPAFLFQTTAGGPVTRYYQSAKELWNTARKYP